MISPLVTLSLLSATALAGPSQVSSFSKNIRRQAKVPSSWKPGVPWQIVEQDPINIEVPLQPTAAKVWDIDLFHASENPDIIPFLKSKADDIVVLCYVNIGAIDTSDPDFGKFPAAAKGKPYEGYPDETWIDIRNPEVVEFMKRRLELAGQVGCDGVDPDNIDGYDPVEKSGFNLEQSDSIAYFTELAKHAHTNLTTGYLMFGQKNAPDLSESLVSIADFAVLEECLGEVAHPDYAFCDQFQNYVNSSPGKPVFEIEYPLSVKSHSAQHMSEPDYQFFCSKKNGNENFSEIIKHSSDFVDGWGQYCGQGADKGSFTTATTAKE